MPYWFLIPGIVSLVTGGCIFILCGEIKRSQKFLGFTFIFEGLLFMLWGIVHGVMTTYYAPTYLLFTIMLLVSPFFYYFAVRYLLKEGGAGKQDLWMLEVVAVFTIVFVAVSSNIPSVQRDIFLQLIQRKIPVVDTLPVGTSVMLALDDTAFLLFVAEQLFIMIFCIVNMAKYMRMLGNIFSNLEGKSTGLFFAMFSLVTLRFIAFSIISFRPDLSAQTWFHIFETIIFVLYYLGLMHMILGIRYTAEELSKMKAIHQNEAVGESDNTASLPAANELISARLGRLVEERFYTDPDINILDLSARIQVNSKYISDYLRFHYDETFLIFINRLRVEYAIELMANPELSLLDIAEQSGFISISTFYRNFTKVKKVSPSHFRKNTAQK